MKIRYSQCICLTKDLYAEYVFKKTPTNQKAKYKTIKNGQNQTPHKRGYPCLAVTLAQMA